MRLAPVLAGVGLGVGVILVGAFLGWYGPLLVCGADGAAVCVAWPGPIAVVAWLLVVGFALGLVVWHAVEWRRGG